MSQKDFLALLLLVLGVVAGVQYARFQFQLDGVEKTVRSLVPEFHQRGSEVYRERLAAVASDYEELRGRFNEAVRRTAVTELVVENGALSVAIRNAGGQPLGDLVEPPD